MASLRKDQQTQHDLFVTDIFDALPVKGDMASMAYPLFSVSTRPEAVDKTFGDGDWWLTLKTTTSGRPTMHDRDVLLFCISHIMQRKNQRRNSTEPISNVVEVSGYELLRQVQREPSQSNYEAIKNGIRRLAGTIIETNIRNGAEVYTKGFSLMDGYEFEDEKGNTKQFRLELSKWVMDAINTDNVLKYHRDYFRLKSSVDKRLYEIARKFVGTKQRGKRWPIKLKNLYSRVEPKSDLKYFRRTIKQTVTRDPLPEFTIEYDGAADTVIFGQRHTSEKPQPKPKFDAKKIPPLTAETLNHAQRILNGRNVDAIHKAWLAELDHKKEMPDDAQTAFLDYCREVIEI